MTGDDLTPDLQFRVRGPDQNFHPRRAGHGRRHFDVATTLADIGERDTVRHRAAETVDFGSESARHALLSPAIARAGDRDRSQRRTRLEGEALWNWNWNWSRNWIWNWSRNWI